MPDRDNGTYRDWGGRPPCNLGCAEGDVCTYPECREDVCEHWWRNLDSGFFCFCSLPIGHREACRCECGAAASTDNLYGTNRDSSR